jgi:hypothetical protein
MTSTVKRALARTGLLPAVRRVRRQIWLATDPAIRERARRYADEFEGFRQRHARVLEGVPAPAPTRTALICGSACPTLEGELALIIALRLAGCRAVVLLQDHWRMLRPYYELAGVDAVRLWGDFDSAGEPSPGADRLLATASTLADAAAITHGGLRVGQAAVSSLFRRLRIGSLDLASPSDRALLAQQLGVSAVVADQSRRMLDAICPDVALFWDTEYSPTAELFDACVGRGVETFAYRTSHQTNGLHLKRYSHANRDDQVSSLSAKSWTMLRQMDWSTARAAALDRELTSGYTRGDWFKECWTQSAAERIDRDDVRRTLGLDPAKKTAVVFSHILWDAPLSWAQPLFATYEDWLVETVRAAAANDLVNWVIKIHPANIGKGARDGFNGESSEERAIRTCVGTLPRHVVLLLPDTPLNALSVFGVMDYCVTVRGTVGIEAARLGVPVLTAARARYSHRGFTVDSATRDEYLSRLQAIDRMPPMSAAERDLAERFAYGMFISRPFVMRSVTWDYGMMGDRPRADIHVRTAEDWRSAPDIDALVRWIRDSQDEDFLADQ